MKISLNLLENDSYIRDKILTILAKQVDSAMQKTIIKVVPKIQKLLENSLKQEPEYRSLVGGQLRLDFGIPDVSVVDNIVKKLSETIIVSYEKSKITNIGIVASVTIKALEKSNMGGLIDDANALVQDTKGYSLPWLKWLLYEGNKPIVKNYEVKIEPNSSSRTGMAVMIESKKNWRVPPEFAGTITNNWITRALDRISTSINKSMKENFESSL